MTVIKWKQQSYNYPNSNTASDTESLHLGSGPVSDVESVTSEPTSPARRSHQSPIISASQIDALLSANKSKFGRKKLRRYHNKFSLQTLNEDEENEGTTVVIMETYKTPFSRLLEDSDALNYWNEFIEKSEEEQSKIIEAFSKTFKSSDNSTVKSDNPYNRISSKIRRTIKIRKNLSLEVVKTSEDDLIGFFKATPKDVYIKYPPTSFDRLLLHAIAQYHGLHSISVLVNHDKRSVKIFNERDEWLPAECFLTDFIAQLRR